MAEVVFVLFFTWYVGFVVVVVVVVVVDWLGICSWPFPQAVQARCVEQMCHKISLF